MPLKLPQSRMFWAVSLGHLVNDMFMGMGPVLLAFLSVSLVPMSNAQIGLVVTVTALIGAVTQPFFGVLADRRGGRFQSIIGATWTVGFFTLAVITAKTGHFWILFFLMAMRAIGNGAFHPAAVMLAGETDEGRAASNMSYFFLMGQVGLAIGPFIAGQMLALANPSTTQVFNQSFKPVYDIPFVWSASIDTLLLISVVMIPLMLLISGGMGVRISTQFRNRDPKPAKPQAQQTSQFALPVKALLILGLMIGVRSMAHPGSVTFIPKLFQEKGWSPAAYGGMVTVFWLSSAFFSIFIGNLADRYDRRWVIMVSMVLSVPCFFFLPLVDGPVAIGLAVLAGGLSGGTHSTIVVMAQDLIPGARGMASGSVLGFIFAMGAVGSFVIGTVSDIIGLSQTFQMVSFLLLVAGLLTLRIPIDNTSTRTIKSVAPKLSVAEAD